MTDTRDDTEPVGHDAIEQTIHDGVDPMDSEHGTPAGFDRADRDLDLYRGTYDRTSDDSLVGVIVEVVAAATGCDTFEVDPLYDCIDPEALETLFEPVSSDGRRGMVTFPVHGYQVTVVDGVRVLVDTSAID